MGDIPIKMSTHTHLYPHTSTNKMKINRMHFSVAVRKRWITERQKIKLENVCFYAYLCVCVWCVCWDRSILRALGLRLSWKHMNYAPCQICPSSESERTREENWMKEKKERTTVSGREGSKGRRKLKMTKCIHGHTKRKNVSNTHMYIHTHSQKWGLKEHPSHHFCCIWSIRLQPSDTHLLPTTAGEKKGEGEAERGERWRETERQRGGGEGGREKWRKWKRGRKMKGNRTTW